MKKYDLKIEKIFLEKSTFKTQKTNVLNGEEK